MRGLPSQVKGVGLKIRFRRNSWVRIPPLALNLWDIGIFKKRNAVLYEWCITVFFQKLPKQKSFYIYLDFVTFPFQVYREV